MSSTGCFPKDTPRWWLPPRGPQKTLEQLERELDEKLEAGLISRQEAEYEYQDFRHRDETWQEL